MMVSSLVTTFRILQLMVSYQVLWFNAYLTLYLNLTLPITTIKYQIPRVLENSTVEPLQQRRVIFSLKHQ